jgi:hypothetical protein
LAGFVAFLLLVVVLVLALFDGLLVVVAAVAEAGLPWLEAAMLFEPPADWLDDIMFEFDFDALAACLAPGAEHFTYLPLASRQRSPEDAVLLLLGQATNLPLASRHCSALAWPARAKHAAAAAARYVMRTMGASSWRLPVARAATIWRAALGSHGSYGNVIAAAVRRQPR